MSTASLGRSYEYKVRDQLITHGWQFIMRAAGSRGCADLLLGHPIHGAALVQVGSKTKTLGPADRARFMDACELIGALPILAIVRNREPIAYWRIDRGKPGAWARWEGA